MHLFSKSIEDQPQFNEQELENYSKQNVRK